MPAQFSVFQRPLNVIGGKINTSFGIVLQDPSLMDALKACHEEIAALVVMDPLEELESYLVKNEAASRLIKVETDNPPIWVAVHLRPGVLAEEAWRTISEALRAHCARMGLGHEAGREILSDIKISRQEEEFKGSSRRLR